MHSLVLNGLLRLDVEFGNSHDFFSGCKRAVKLYPLKPDSGCIKTVAAIHRARMHLADQLIVGSCFMNRSVSFEADTDSCLFDMVSRFVVTDSSCGRPASINGKLIVHRSSNIYHQYPAGTVRVPVGRTQWLEFTGEVSGMPPDGFEHVFYVRDESRSDTGNKWIVHHRMVATAEAQYLIVRGCNPRFEGPISPGLSRIIPRGVKRALFRIRERRYPWFPVMVVGENVISAGTTVTLDTRTVLHG